MLSSIRKKDLTTTLWLALGALGCAPRTSEPGSGETRQIQATDSATRHPSSVDASREGQQPDAANARASQPYVLCDGSDQVRLAIKQGGGQVESGYDFRNRHGYRFLFVTGGCSFVAGTEFSPLAGHVEGTLSHEQAEQLTNLLKLPRLSGISYVDPQSCPDAGMLSVATTAGYADCTCGCDEGAPNGVAEVLGASDAAFALVRSAGHAAAGAIELVAVADEVPLKRPSEALQEWPFSWSLREVAITQRQYRAKVRAVSEPRALTGDDAEKARALRDRVLTSTRAPREIHVSEGEQSYELYLRDQIAPSLADAIASFEAQHDPWAAKPLEICRDEPARGVQFSSADLYDGVLRSHLAQGSACNLRVCWEQAFNESYPVQAFLQVQESADGRRCLGRVDSLQTDLTPLKQAFQHAYPKTSIEIDLGLAGYQGQLFVEDWTRENAACTQLSLSECANDQRCRVLSGTPFDLTRGCSGTATPVACAAKPTACDDAITPARALDGSTYWFSNGCLPETFAAFYPEDVQPDTLPRCGP